MSRPPKPETLKAMRYVAKGKGTIAQAAKKYGIDRTTLWRAIEKAKHAQS